MIEQDVPSTFVETVAPSIANSKPKRYKIAGSRTEMALVWTAIPIAGWILIGAIFWMALR